MAVTEPGAASRRYPSATLAVAAAAVALGLTVVALLPGQIDGTSLRDALDLGSAGFFPLLAAALLVLLGTLIAITTAFDPAPNSGEAAAGRSSPMEVLRLALILVAYAIGIGTLGMIASTALMMVAVALVFGYRRYAVIVALALITPLAIVGLFEKLLLILFPRGWLF